MMEPATHFPMWLNHCITAKEWSYKVEKLSAEGMSETIDI